jgi:hypothetical protein
LAAENSRFYAARIARNPGFRTNSVPLGSSGIAENDRHFDSFVRRIGISDGWLGSRLRARSLSILRCPKSSVCCPGRKHSGVPSWTSFLRAVYLQTCFQRGSYLGPLAPEYHAKRRYGTQNKPICAAAQRRSRDQLTTEGTCLWPTRRWQADSFQFTSARMMSFSSLGTGQRQLVSGTSFKPTHQKSSNPDIRENNSMSVQRQANGAPVARRTHGIDNFAAHCGSSGPCFSTETDANTLIKFRRVYTVSLLR